MNTINKSEIVALASSHSSGVSRRSFLATSAVASGGLILGIALPGAVSEAQAAGALHTPNAWVHIADDNTITLLSARSEMGQGVYTSMPMLIAEELNVDIRKIKFAIAPPNVALYGNALLGGPQLTGGSTSVRDGWEKLRLAGAQVREMLITAAADQWKVDRSTLRAENGMVLGAKGKTATYGSLAAAASKLPVPEKVALKDPKDFTIVGKRTKRLDTPAKINGTAEFGIDVKLPGMVHASIEMCPVIGGTVKSFDATKARAMPGVIDVVQIPDGVAIVADTWWHAKNARQGLTVVCDEGAGATLDDKTMLAGIRTGSATDKVIPMKAVGDADAVIRNSAKFVRAEYTMPLLAHALLEPMNFTAHFHDNKVDLIGPTQWQDAAQSCSRENARREARRRDPSHHLPRRRLRPAHRHRLHHPGGADLQGRQQAGQVAVDARRRHDARLLPAAVGAHAGRRPRRERQAHGDELQDGFAIGDRPCLRLACRCARPVDDRGGGRGLRDPCDQT